jgi:hypothetical protein
MTHYTNTGNPIDFPKKKDIPMLEKFAAQSLVEYDGELIFSKEKFAELIVQECADICYHHSNAAGGVDTHFGYGYKDCGDDIKRNFGVKK